MSNEEGSSSHSVDSQVEILPTEDKVFQSLLDYVVKLDEHYKFSPIYTVPSRLREVDPSSFIPRVVSIGPLHKGLKNLKSMENKKVTYLSDLLNKIGSLAVGSPEETLRDTVRKVRGQLEQIRRYYFGMDEKSYDDDKIVEMMVMDGCFILQFIDNLSDNLLLENRLRSRNIALDLVLLENQIPFFVLQDIYDLTVKRLEGRPTLTTMLGSLLKLVNPFSESLKVENVGTETPFHILGLLHKFYKPDFRLSSIEDIPTALSAVDLDKVGVRIMPNNNLTWPMAMKFEYSVWSHKPTLKTPIVRIDNFFEVVLRNLIAYEQYSPVDNYVTSYAIAMHMLAATQADVAKLRKSGVINVSHLVSNEKASDMISSICKNVNWQDFYYMEPWKNIDQHYKSYWPRHFGVFKRTYIDTPWKAIALLAAIIVFLITVIQFFRLLVIPFH